MPAPMPMPIPIPIDAASSSQHRHDSQNPQRPSLALAHPPLVAHLLAPDDDDAKAKNRRKRSASTAASARTGQACDRCKHRKIRCDSTPGGCLPCQQNHTECRTTDRNTNRATTRGHTEALERDNTVLHQQIWDLQAQLRALGVVPRVLAPPHHPSEAYSPAYAAEDAFRGSQDDPSAQPSPQPPPKEVNIFAHPEARGPLPAETPFANGSDGLLSTSTGLTLSVFGMNLELAAFATHPSDQPGGSHSYDTFMGLVQGGSKTVKIPELGTYKQYLHMADQFLSACNPWHPILHPPEIMKLVEQIFVYGYTPTPAEKVIVHIIPAYLLYQNAVRTTGKPEEQEHMRKMSDGHYHYALTMVINLLCSRTLKDMQGLAMICLMMRSFVNSLEARTLLSWTLTAAIDNKMHRSANSLPADAVGKDTLTIETRKRVFWIILMLLIPILGKLGLPMPLRLADVDIEFPEMLNDDLQPAGPGDNPRTDCRYFHAIAFFKVTKIYIQMFDAMYGVKVADDYERKLRELEGKAQAWIDHDCPRKTKGPLSSLADNNLRVMALWMKFQSYEFLVLLHHPSRCPTHLVDLYYQNIEVCIEVSCGLIQAAIELWRYKSLDTAWHTNCALFSAVFTYLFCLEQRGRVLSPTEMGSLKVNLNSCLEIFVDIGNVLGSGTKLKAEMTRIFDAVVEKIASRELRRTASAAVATSNMNDSATVHPPSQPQLETESTRSPNSATSSNNALSAPYPHAPDKDYAPASDSTYIQRPASTVQHHPQAHMLSPSGPGAFPQYDYATNQQFLGSALHAQAQYPTYNPAPAPFHQHVQSPQQNMPNAVWDSWMEIASQDGAPVPRAMPYSAIDPAAALFAVGVSGLGEGHAGYMMGQGPVPGQGLQGMMPGQGGRGSGSGWPVRGWGGVEGRGEGA